MTERRITKIEPQKNNPGRRNIFVDGEFVLGVSDETVLRAGLRTGDVVTGKDLDELRERESVASAKNAAMRFLSYRPRTEREIRNKLRETEHAEGDIESVVQDLKRAGLIDDRAFAKMYIRDTRAARPSGPILLKQKMILLGINKETIEEALRETMADVSQEDEATEAAKKFLAQSGKSGRKVDPERLRSRLTGLLARRGFSWDVIGRVVQKTLTLHDKSNESP
jgi:regulatory protein